MSSAGEEVARMHVLIDNIEKRVEALEKSRQERGKLRFSFANSPQIQQPVFTAETTNGIKGTEAEQTIVLEVGVNNAQTTMGQKVFVIGNVKELGAWDISGAVPLSTTPETYPGWHGTVEITNNGEPIVVKFCKLTENDPSSVQWDNHADYTITPQNTDGRIKKVVEWHD